MQMNLEKKKNDRRVEQVVVHYHFNGIRERSF